MKIILTLLSSLILLVDCTLFSKISKKISLKPFRPVVKHLYYEYEDWTHGEVPWDLAFEDPGTNKVLKNQENSQKLWQMKETKKSYYTKINFSVNCIKSVLLIVLNNNTHKNKNWKKMKLYLIHIKK
jgi:hypothetical protein